MPQQSSLQHGQVMLVEGTNSVPCRCAASVRPCWYPYRHNPWVGITSSCHAHQERMESQGCASLMKTPEELSKNKSIRMNRLNFEHLETVTENVSPSRPLRNQFYSRERYNLLNILTSISCELFLLGALLGVNQDCFGRNSPFMCFKHQCAICMFLRNTSFTLMNHTAYIHKNKITTYFTVQESARITCK